MRYKTIMSDALPSIMDMKRRPTCGDLFTQQHVIESFSPRDGCQRYNIFGLIFVKVLCLLCEKKQRDHTHLRECFYVGFRDV